VDGLDGIQGLLESTGSVGVMASLVFYLIRSAFPKMMDDFRDSLAIQRREFSQTLQEEREAHRDTVSTVETRWEKQTDRVEGAIQRNTQILEEVRDKITKGIK